MENKADRSHYLATAGSTKQVEVAVSLITEMLKT